MNEREAQEIIRMVESNWQFDLGTARGIWRTEFMLYSAEAVTKAVASLAPKLQFKPKLADVIAIVKMQEDTERRRLEDEKRRAEDARAITEGKRGYATPEWTFVWQWARSSRIPREDRAFPQQRDWSHPDNLMSKEDYEMLRQEWIAAGSPKELGKRALPEVVTR